MPDTPKRFVVGCVSYLNSKPLIDPLVDRPDVEVHFAVPARLVDLMAARQVDAALMPIVDYQNCPVPVVLSPGGAICCDGPTLTVRIFSKVPLTKTQKLYADTDSHSSVILAQIVLRELHNRQPEVIVTNMYQTPPAEAKTLLLIGDKVVNGAPPDAQYPYQLDLGEQWKVLTGLPFVFAMWMMPADRANVELAALLAGARQRGGEITEHLVAKYAEEKHWPPELARRYFTEYLQYAVTPRCRLGIEKFFELAGKHQLLRVHRAIRYMDAPSRGPSTS
ncbi:MAG: menaquinone biosynthetic enzyme MqnA/MqnD family protein [Phycisphaerae bacterium]